MRVMQLYWTLIIVIYISYEINTGYESINSHPEGEVISIYCFKNWTKEHFIENAHAAFLTHTRFIHFIFM